MTEQFICHDNASRRQCFRQDSQALGPVSSQHPVGHHKTQQSAASLHNLPEHNFRLP